MSVEELDDETALARLITASIAGRRWRDLTPLDIARHLVANGVQAPTPAEPTSEERVDG